MSQPLTVVAEIDPPAAERVRTLVRAWRDRAIDAPADAKQPLPIAAALPTVHFMSLSMFEDTHWDPLLVLESNVDGGATEHWEAMDRALAADLRPVLACTKSARLADWRDVFAAGSNRPIAGFLAAHAIDPVAYHVGNPGLTVARIRRDAALFERTQAWLGTAPPVTTAADTHAAMRASLLEDASWLDEPLEPRPFPAHAAARRTLAAVAAAVLLTLAAILTAVVWGPPWLRWTVVGAFFAALALVVAGAVQLRKYERSDPVQDAPGASPDEAAIRDREDRLMQNHLASLVVVKPGAVRAVLIRLGTWVLKQKVLAQPPSGWLGQMRTIHFAQWCLVQNGGRFLFLSNYDGSWDSYLDDFINKAAAGLTLAWTNCVGFPRTRWLLREGAADGRRFRAWARQSQRESLFWYNAYKNLTVNQIERNAAVVDGLRRPAMTEAAAAQWAKLL